MRVHRAIATVHAMGVHHVAMGGATEVNRDVMIVVRREIVTMGRGLADQAAMVNGRAPVATWTLAKAARITMRARCAKASRAKVGRTTSAAIRARSSGRHAPRNRPRRAPLASR